jgi:2-succinyl-6-hydroxy-2,4-cyclohexadiene-1-carboxylate synthase
MAEQPTSRRIAVNGIEMAYEDRGSGARPFVLLHGFTGSRRDFAPRVSELAAFGRIVLPDLRGHGESTNTGAADGYTLEQLTLDLVGFLDARGIDRCDLLGHSMGGMVALRAVLARPERFGSLVLMDTSARVPDDLSRAAIELGARVALEAGMQPLAKLLRARAASPEADRTDADRRLETEWGDRYWSDWRFPNYHAMDPFALAALGAALFDQLPLTARLGEIHCPTLVMVGSGDTGFLRAADELELGIPGARLAVIPDAGHQPQLENPAAWLAALRDHLARARESV